MAAGDGEGGVQGGGVQGVAGVRKIPRYSVGGSRGAGGITRDGGGAKRGKAGAARGTTEATDTTATETSGRVRTTEDLSVGTQDDGVRGK